MSILPISRALLLVACIAVAMTGCAGPSSADTRATQRGDNNTSSSATVTQLALLNRVTWGVSNGSWHAASEQGLAHYLQQQLHPSAAILPNAIREQIAAMTISRQALPDLIAALESSRKAADGIQNDDAKKVAQQAYQQELNQVAREAATRSLLRDLHSSNQLQEQMTWFWMNHFSVFQGKSNLRAMMGDYEEVAIRPHALGKFRDLLRASAHHPAMLRYLDNEANAVGHINENYARELMELHTLGVNGGYSQRDVQELARILTGVGVNIGSAAPSVRRELQAQYLRQGVFEFNPNRHDYGDKQFLGQVVHGRGLSELDEALDRLSRHPATARFVSTKLALFMMGASPSPALVDRLAKIFLTTDGDIAATLQGLFESTEFTQSLGREFKDPLHYVVSAVHLAYDDKTILNTGPMLNWLNRMAEPLYGRPTPDGYPLTASDWASPGQMTTRFEIAKAIGAGSAGLFKTDGPQPQERAAFPQLANALYFEHLQSTLKNTTRQALDQAGSPQEWNAFLLSSPEMMNR